MVEIEILTTCITSQYGTLKTGDILRCPKDFADHIVNEAMAAKYRTTQEPEQPKAEPEQVKPAVKTKQK